MTARGRQRGRPTVYWWEVNRRHFLLGTLAAPAIAASKKLATRATPVERPNIVLVVAQDLGAYMVGCYANTEIHTPNIDRLAQTGVRFAESFAGTPAGRDAGPFAAAGFNIGKADSGTQAVEFLDAQAAGKPFFLTIEWPSPTTVTPAQTNIDLYAETGFESVGWESTALNATHKDMLRNPQGNLRKYAASLTTLDDTIAPWHAKLEGRGLLENTLIVFASTSGFLVGHHGLWGGAAASNPPNMFEEVVRTPLIWCWPSRFPPQTVRNDLVNSFDLMPALCELAGVAAPAGSSGATYLPFVYGRSLGKKQVWADMAYGKFQDTEMARDDRYKLVLRNGGKGPNEFYDLIADVREFNNEYDNTKFANKRDRLAGQLAAWRGQK